MLEKNKALRRVTFVFTNDSVHESVECQYTMKIIEDGQEISNTNIREIGQLSDMLDLVNNAEVYELPDPVIP